MKKKMHLLVAVAAVALIAAAAVGYARLLLEAGAAFDHLSASERRTYSVIADGTYNEEHQDNLTLRPVQLLGSITTADGQTLFDAADAYGYLATIATAAYASTAGVAIMFEDQFSQVHRTADLVGDEVGAMKEELIDLTREIPTSFGNLADVAAIGGQIGIAKDDIV